MARKKSKKEELIEHVTFEIFKKLCPDWKGIKMRFPLHNVSVNIKVSVIYNAIKKEVRKTLNDKRNATKEEK